MRQNKKVALIIESSRSFGRGLLRGVAAYIRTHGPWSIYQHERALGDAPPEWLQNFQGDGIIARIESNILSKEITCLGLPTVDLQGRYTIPGVPVIKTNDLTVVRKVCDHLLECGLRNLAFCGFSGVYYSDRRKTCMIEYLAELGLTPSIGKCQHFRTSDTSKIEAKGYLQKEELGDWLLSLPKPVGLLACNDIRAQQVLDVCRERGIHVPDEIAVVGVDDDDIICELTDPPLTSVQNDTEQIGYKAASLLARMMEGEIPSHEPLLISPTEIIIRQSTNILTVDDAEVTAAIGYIRDHACDGISVGDVVKHVQLSRSTLERKFLKALGRGPKSEITRVRIGRVKELLEVTDYKLVAIARQTGYAHPEHMCAIFKKHMGQAPGQYRKIHHSGIEAKWNK